MTRSGALHGPATPVLPAGPARLARASSAQESARRNSLAIRPYIENRECIEPARLQLTAGASGVTAPKTTPAPRKPGPAAPPAGGQRRARGLAGGGRGPRPLTPFP